MQRMIAAAAVALLVGGVGGYVLHGQGRITVLGSGIISCGKWLEYRREKSSAAINSVSWVNGYLTGLQDDSAGNYGLTDNQAGDLEGRSAWLDQYCQGHPIDDLKQASYQLYNALGAKR